MALKQIVVPLDDSENGFSALHFVLKNFGMEKNELNILWLGAKCIHPEKAIDVKLPHAMARLGVINSSSREKIRAILETEYPNILTNIHVTTLEHFTRKQFSTLCSFSDCLVSTFSMYFEYLYPLFEHYTSGKKYARVCCPKILISDEFDHVENIILVKTDQTNTVATVKQFCHLFCEKCDEVKLNLLDLEDFQEHGGTMDSQKLLVDYLKYHTCSPAIFPYSGEDSEHLAEILNLNSNTLWVSPLESVEELKFISPKVVVK